MIIKGETLIKVENLQKHFGDNKVLDGINTEIHKGEVVAIIGPSGSGKSTFSPLSEPSGGSYGRKDTFRKCRHHRS